MHPQFRGRVQTRRVFVVSEKRQQHRCQGNPMVDGGGGSSRPTPTSIRIDIQSGFYVHQDMGDHDVETKRTEPPGEGFVEFQFG